MGWNFPWASSLGTDFNFDFNVSLTEEQQREGQLNTTTGVSQRGQKTDRRLTDETWRGPVAEHAAMTGTDVATYTRERPGMSAFVLEDGVVYHTYSTYARGLDGLWGMYQWLDRAPKGRNETGIWCAVTTNTRRLLKTPARVATLRRRTREPSSLLPTATRERDDARRPASRLRRGGKIVSWIVPSATLALLPSVPPVWRRMWPSRPASGSLCRPPRTCGRCLCYCAWRHWFSLLPDDCGV